MSDEELRKIIAEQEITFGRDFWRDEALSLVIELPLPPSVLALTEIDPPYAHGKGLPELNESD